MSELHRFGIKLFLSTGEEPPLAAFIPVFHRWIQSGALDGLWIDVADYSHVRGGPGVLLIGHEANLSIDESGGRRGLLISWKRPIEGRLEERLLAATRTLLRAARQLEDEPELPIRFRSDELEVVFNDRLRAPNDAETFARLRPELETFLTRFFDPGAVSLEHETDPRERLSVRARASHAAEGIQRLLADAGV